MSNFFGRIEAPPEVEQTTEGSELTPESPSVIQDLPEYTWSKPKSEVEARLRTVVLLLDRSNTVVRATALLAISTQHWEMRE
jgi:hypothetical protein